MRNKNTPFNYDTAEDENVTWDSLKYVPFAGDKKQQPKNTKTEIINTLREVYKHKKHREPMSAHEFLFILFDAIQPFLAQGNTSEFRDDYNFWKEALSEIGPCFACFWAECDPALISYLLMVFVAQFMVLLRLWAKMDYSPLCIKDCSRLGEFFLSVGLIQSDMLQTTLKQWNLEDADRPSFLPVNS